MRTKLDEIINKIRQVSKEKDFDINDDNDYIVSLENNIRIYINNDLIKVVHNRSGGTKNLFYLRAIDGYQDLINDCIKDINDNLILDAYEKIFGG